MISSPVRTVIAKQIIAPQWQLVLRDGSPDTVVTEVTAAKDDVARRAGENEYAFCFIDHMRLHSSNQEIGAVTAAGRKKN